MIERTKIIAFYLPQYHEIKENNEWWGEGFTEWVNVRRAKPLFNGHYQPKVPLKKNYYDLSNVKTLQWQATLVNNYGLDGLCFYHYWFEGKRLLEKPLQMLLNHKEIELPFCISWANGTWSRTWTREERKVLIEQTYGGEADWEAHFEELLPYFKDSRYIKINNNPILLLYKSYEIPKCAEMIRYWNKRMKENGLAELYVIETLTAMNGKCHLKEESQACVEFEPLYTIYQRISYRKKMEQRLFNRILSRWRIYTLSYDYIWKNIFHREIANNKKTFYGAFPEWDNTARKGTYGLAVNNATPKKFENNLSKQYKRSLEEKKEVLFINAWNEWGEGAYLEPDELHGYQYLEAIKRVKENCIFFER